LFSASRAIPAIAPPVHPHLQDWASRCKNFRTICPGYTPVQKRGPDLRLFSETGYAIGDSPTGFGTPLAF
jgi:hypothetical protein